MATRRDFIKASAAVGALGISEASAKTVKTVKTVRKTAGRRVSVPLIGSIAVVSSIPYSNALETAFKAGVNSVMPTFDNFVRQDRLGYRRKLHQAVRTYNKADSVGLIVTVGGLIAFDAALFTSTKPFVSMLAGNPDSLPVPAGPSNSNFKFWGGVDLGTYAATQKMITDLRGSPYSLSPNQISLVHNPNSLMAGAETTMWEQWRSPGSGMGLGPVVPVGINANDENDWTSYASTFQIPAGVVGVIISADPFFNHTRGDLIDAANAFIGLNPQKNLVYYPLQHYSAGGIDKNGNGTLKTPTVPGSLFYGRDLDAAYKALGVMTGKAYQSGPQSIQHLG